jgi:hypothetical protein
MLTFKRIAKKVVLVILVLAGLLVCTKIVRRTFFAQRTVVHKHLLPGANLSLPETDWSQSESTMVLFLNEGCGFSAASAPFYQRLTEALKEQDKTRLLVVMSNTKDDTQRYLGRIGVQVAETRQVDFDDVGIERTPTLAIVDGRGKVTKMWIGQLKPQQEEALLAKMVATTIK